MRTLLNDIRDKLQTSALFKYIDDDWGQLDDYSVNPPTKWPCALVDIIDAKPQDLGRHVQLMECTILIRVADLRLSNSSQQAPKDQQTKSRDLFSIAQTIFSILHGWHKEGSAYGTISRIGLRRNHRDDGIREYHILFKSQMRDVAAAIVTDDLSELVKSEVITPKINLIINH
jgi:hypothetical protein